MAYGWFFFNHFHNTYALDVVADETKAMVSQLYQCFLDQKGRGKYLYQVRKMQEWLSKYPSAKVPSYGVAHQKSTMAAVQEKIYNDDRLLSTKSGRFFRTARSWVIGQGELRKQLLSSVERHTLYAGNKSSILAGPPEHILKRFK